MENKK